MEQRMKAAKNQILISFKQKHESDIREDIFMVYSSSEKKKDKKDMHHQYHCFSSRFILQLVVDHGRFAKNQSTSSAEANTAQYNLDTSVGVFKTQTGLSQFIGLV